MDLNSGPDLASVFQPKFSTLSTFQYHFVQPARVPRLETKSENWEKISRFHDTNQAWAFVTEYFRFALLLPGRGIGKRCNLNEFFEYRCVVCFSKLLGTLMIIIASNGHFCEWTNEPIVKNSTFITLKRILWPGIISYLHTNTATDAQFLGQTGDFRIWTDFDAKFSHPHHRTRFFTLLTASLRFAFIFANNSNTGLLVRLFVRLISRHPEINKIRN